MTPELQKFDDFPSIRKNVFDSVLNEFQQNNVVENDKIRLQLDDLKYDQNKDYSIDDQKKALLKNQDLSWRLSGNWKLIDKDTNKVLETRHDTIAHIPYITDRGTFIRGGNEYTVVNQLRLRPGVYTRKTAAGDLEAHFNVKPGTGSSFRLHLDPESGKFFFVMGQAKVPLYPVLRTLGVVDKDLNNEWGSDLFRANQTENEKAVKRLYSHLNLRAADPAELSKSFVDKIIGMKVDPLVTQSTLGLASENVNPQLILAATKKLLALNRKEVEPDDRDSLEFQTIHSFDDFLKERIKRDKANVFKSLLFRIQMRNKSLKGVPNSIFDEYVNQVFRSSFAMPLEEINPIEIADQHYRTVRLGEGGISSSDAIPDESRNVHPSQMGFIDPIRGPESGKIGVDSRIARNTFKGKDNVLYSRMLDSKGKETFLPTHEAVKVTIGFPGESDSGEPLVRAISNGKLQFVPREKVNFWLPDSTDMFSNISNLVPMMSTIKGHRLLMGSKMVTQALPLKEAESPLVQSQLPGDSTKSFEDQFGEFLGAIKAKGNGEIIDVTPTSITIKYADGTKQTHEMYKSFPFNRKTFIENRPLVQPGQLVKAGQPLAASNFTDAAGTAALGKNLRVAFIPWKGKNYEDAYLISESAAKKLTSEHMFTFESDPDSHKVVGKSDFIGLHPTIYNSTLLKNMDSDGVIKEGTVVKHGDPLILAIKDPDIDVARAMHRAVSTTPENQTITWDGEETGVVTDIVKSGKNRKVIVKSYFPMKVGDKMANRFGNKGVIAEIIPDHLMPQDADGKPFEVLANPLGLISRVNPAQVIETALAKIADKTGKVYKMKGFDPHTNYLEFALDELKKNGLKSADDIFDPERQAKIPRVFNGKMFFMKLSHIAEGKISGRGGSGDEGSRYTWEGLPAGGGDTGSKRLGMAEVNALISHGAWNVIRDAHLIRGQRNDDYWKALRLGYSIPTPKGGMIYDKFLANLKASGINTSKKGNQINIMALTDRDITSISNGEIKNDETVDPRTLEPIAGGLFDAGLTGGHRGKQWNHISLTEPMPNPVMEKVIRSLFNLTENDFRDVLSGNKELQGQTGPKAIFNALNEFKVDRAVDQAKTDIQSGRVTKRDPAIKRLGYLLMFKQTGLKPIDMMWTKLPVLPTQFRPVTKLGKDVVVSSDVNDLYRDFFKTNQNLKELKGLVGDEGIKNERLNLYDSIKAISGLGDPIGMISKQKELKGLLRQVFGSSPKLGLFQHSMIGRSQDVTGRAVITPDPNLDLDEVGIPEEKAWVLYSPFIVRRLVRSGTSAVQAAKQVANKTEQAKKALLEEMEQRPVIINRAPTLHKFSIQAFWPKLNPHNTLTIPPLVTSGFGADFDGDAMNFHVPVSEEAKKDAIDKLMPSKHLLNSLKFDVQYIPSQEYLAGLYQASSDVSHSPIRTFRSADDAIVAFKRGKIKATDRIEILESKR
jgi:DNA-directed RNA polymerase beta subunit